MLNAYLELDKAIRSYQLSIDTETHRIHHNLKALKFKDSNFY